MSAEGSVNENFYELYLGNDEAEVDEEMKHRRNHVLEHLLLPKCYEQNTLYSFGSVTAEVFFFTQLNVVINSLVAAISIDGSHDCERDKQISLKVCKHSIL